MGTGAFDPLHWSIQTTSVWIKHIIGSSDIVPSASTTKTNGGLLVERKSFLLLLFGDARASPRHKESGGSCERTRKKLDCVIVEVATNTPFDILYKVLFLSLRTPTHLFPLSQYGLLTITLPCLQSHCFLLKSSHPVKNHEVLPPRPLGRYCDICSLLCPQRPNHGDADAADSKIHQGRVIHCA